VEHWLDDAHREKCSEILLRGFIDTGTFEQLEKRLETAFNRQERFLILNFADVHYINSTGISILIRYYDLYRERGGSLVLASVSKSVGVSLHLLGVTSIIPFHKDRDAALAALSKSLRETAAEPAGAHTAPPASPVAAAPRRTFVLPLMRRRRPLNGARVLLLLPRPNRFSRVLRRRFQRLNGDFKISHSTQEAAEIIHSLEPDLVVLDHRMDPRGDFTARLKLQPKRSLISVIKIYEKGSVVEPQADFRIWENDYLVDPFDVLELFSLSEAELMRVPRDRKTFHQQVRFEFGTTPENLEKANKLSESVIRNCLSSDEDRTALIAAVKEGLDNASRHGNGWDGAKTIDVSFLIDRHKATVIVEDQGSGFDFEYYLSRLDDKETFERARRRILEEDQRGGLGILLMHRCVDRIEYSGSGNVLRLEKNRA
jgi:anti-sigma B factor antagonist